MAGDPSILGAWQLAHPARCTDWFATVRAPWWVAGGWALDLHAGRQSRPHGDLDVGVLRRDVREALAALSCWEVFEVTGGECTPLRTGAAPRSEVNSLWCRPKGASLWSMELMLDESDRDFWVFRRQPDIRLPLSMAIRRNSDGLPYLTPEIQLLYKAKQPRRRIRSISTTSPRGWTPARAPGSGMHWRGRIPAMRGYGGCSSLHRAHDQGHFGISG
ncbi:MAG: hypothetical protein WBF89_04755 [Steroidobacteraceae bacterium]